MLDDPETAFILRYLSFHIVISISIDRNFVTLIKYYIWSNTKTNTYNETVTTYMTERETSEFHSFLIEQ